MNIRYKAIIKAKEVLEPLYNDGIVSEHLGKDVRNLINSIEDIYMRVAVATVIDTGRFTIGYDKIIDANGNIHHKMRWYLMMPKTKECLKSFIYVAKNYKSNGFFGIYDYPYWDKD